MRPSLIHGMMLAAAALAAWPRGVDAHGHFRSRYETVYAAPVETVLVEPTTYVVPTDYVVREAPVVATSYLVESPRWGLFGRLLPTRYYRVTETAFAAPSYVLPTRYVATSLTTFDLPIVETSATLCCDLPRASSPSCCDGGEIIRDGGSSSAESPEPGLRRVVPSESGNTTETNSKEITSTPSQKNGRAGGTNESSPARVAPRKSQDADVEAPEPPLPEVDNQGELRRDTTPPKVDSTPGGESNPPAAPKAVPATPKKDDADVTIPTLDDLDKNIMPTSYRRSARRETPSESGAVVEGKVILQADRTPDAGVSVVMVDVDRKQSNRIATSDALGRFALFAPDGTWELTVIDTDGKRYYYGDFKVNDGLVRDLGGKIYSTVTLKH